MTGLSRESAMQIVMENKEKNMKGCVQTFDLYCTFKYLTTEIDYLCFLSGPVWKNISSTCDSLKFSCGTGVSLCCYFFHLTLEQKMLLKCNFKCKFMPLPVLRLFRFIIQWTWLTDLNDMKISPNVSFLVAVPHIWCRSGRGYESMGNPLEKNFLLNTSGRFMVDWMIPR